VPSSFETNTTIAGTPPENPGHALRFDRDQYGLTAEEDLIEAGDHHQRPGDAVQALEEPTGLEGLLRNPVAYGRGSRTEGSG
jgi:hypothetical protein